MKRLRVQMFPFKALLVKCLSNDILFSPIVRAFCEKANRVWKLAIRGYEKVFMA